MIQDQIVFCVEKNLSLSFILTLGFEEFDSLHGSCLRNHASSMVDNAWIRMIAAQGKAENMEKWIDRWRKVMDQNKSDLGAFLKDFGKGI